MRDKLYLVLEAHLHFLSGATCDYCSDVPTVPSGELVRRANDICRSKPVPIEALGYYVIDDDGNPKCLSFNDREVL